jgi:hypothetical protein
VIYYCQLHKKFDAAGIHNIPNKLIRYYRLTLFLIKAHDIIEILNICIHGYIVTYPILLLIVKIDMILFTKTNGIELYTNTHV